MLVCRACNTRYQDGREACPSCGRRSSRNATEAGESGPLPLVAPLRQAAGAIDLEEASVVEERRPASTRPAERKETKAASPARSTSEAATVPVLPNEIDLAQVKALLAEQPELLEKGLGIYADDDGEPEGVDFATPVGSIDLLMQDRKGGFVLVHLPAPDEVDDSVSAMLRRMGWVRKHLAEDGGEVRGVVVVDQLPEDLVYAAAGAGGAIRFKSCRVAVTFHDLDA